jgi:hypothetical protein
VATRPVIAVGVTDNSDISGFWGMFFGVFSRAFLSVVVVSFAL